MSNTIVMRVLIATLALAVIVMWTVVGFTIADGDNEPRVCTQESHYLITPFDGGTAHDGRTVYTGDCAGFSS